MLRTIDYCVFEGSFAPADRNGVGSNNDFVNEASGVALSYVWVGGAQLARDDLAEPCDDVGRHGGAFRTQLKLEPADVLIELGTTRTVDGQPLDELAIVGRGGARFNEADDITNHPESTSRKPARPRQAFRGQQHAHGRQRVAQR